MKANTNNEITIVTAFFDIGRGSIPNEINGKTIPDFQKRTNDKYFEYFNNLAKIKNDMIIYTTKNFESKIYDTRLKHGNSNTKVISLDSYFVDKEYNPKNKCLDIMNSKDFISNVDNPHYIEYWNIDYVLINLFKSFYVVDAIKMGLVNTDLAAWIDFGYCRDDNEILNIKWTYPFEKNKIHLFNMKQIETEISIQNIVYSGEVYIQGCHIVAESKMWEHLKNLAIESFNDLISKNLVDDDQTVLLLSYLKDQKSFTMRYNDSSDWFRIFKDYNIKEL
jgi:protein YibB